MMWTPQRVRRQRASSRVAAMRGAARPGGTARSAKGSTRPADTRPRSLVPPGESRYHKAGGLRVRLAAAAAEGTDVHVAVDYTALRRRLRRRVIW